MVAAKGKKPHEVSTGQKEMLLPNEGNRGAEKKKAGKPERTSKRKAE
jgi:DNA end-binding protein Ku